jgi:hypothetical protein
MVSHKPQVAQRKHQPNMMNKGKGKGTAYDKKKVLKGASAQPLNAIKKKLWHQNVVKPFGSKKKKKHKRGPAGQIGVKGHAGKADRAFAKSRT